MIGRIRLTCFVLAALAHALSARAQPTLDVGVGPDALPAVEELGFATPLPPGAALAGTLGYGFIESVPGTGDAHHQLITEVGGSYGLMPELALAVGMTSHFDAHVGGPSDGDTGFVAGSHLRARGRMQLKPSWHLGGEVGLSLPAADNASRGLRAVTPELRGLVSYQLARFLFGGSLGVRIDRSAQGIEDVEALSAADRATLGASESSAILLVIGGHYVIDPRLHALAELSLDAAVGKNAPALFDSPLRLIGGARYFVNERLQVQGLLLLSPSGRPGVAPTDPIAPIEPRIALLGSVAYAFGPRTPAPVLFDVAGRVVDTVGRPIAGATVELDPAQTANATTGSDGVFVLRSVQGTRLSLRATAEHHEPAVRVVTFAAQAASSGAAQAVGDLMLTRARGAVTGRVLGPSGMPVANAEVAALEDKSETVPAVQQTVSAADGRFAFAELPAGPITLRVRAHGLRSTDVDVVIPARGSIERDVQLPEELPAGQIRGTVRSARGGALVAEVQLEPLGQLVLTGIDGTFSLDVAPGKYSLLVTAAGYEPQEREATVEQDGVTVLLIDLSPQP